MDSFDLRQLNSAQHDAVTCMDSRLLILAGAGCGKTKVLMMRIAYLVLHAGVDPRTILGLTFTNKAAGEMRERLAHLLGPSQASKVTLSTFHSFCLELLRQYAPILGFTSSFSLYHEYEVRRLLQQLVRDELEHGLDLPPLGPTLARITQARYLGTTPGQLPIEGSLWHHDLCQRLFERLKATFKAYDAMDFDGLLEYALELVQSHGVLISSHYPLNHVLIDEYQDTNPIQDLLAHQLAANANLCVVGDDDQSIYGWRGAQVRNILDFPATKRVTLEQNYRSTNTVLKVANQLIAHNNARYFKSLWSAQGEGEKVEVFHAPSVEHEAGAVIERMVRLKYEHGWCWRDFAILYRSNTLARPIESALLQRPWEERGSWHHSIPYAVFGGESLYETREVADLLAYLQLLVNPSDGQALLRIINQPRRGVGEESVARLMEHVRQGMVPVGSLLSWALETHLLPAKAHKGIGELHHILEQGRQALTTLSLDELLVWLQQTTHYERAIEEEVKSQKMRSYRLANLEQLVETAREFRLKTPLQGQALVNAFIASFNVEGPSRNLSFLQQDVVHLMTFHSAKGLEFKAVFLIGLEEELLPHERSQSAEAIEEERRLFYVAMTRAKERLCLSMSTRRHKKGKEETTKPSRFLFELPQTLLKITRWDLSS